MWENRGMVPELPPDGRHANKRSDLLAGSLAALGISMPMLLGPEWGWPLLAVGFAGIAVYFVTWRSRNPAWLGKALWGILVLLIATSSWVLAWRLFRPTEQVVSSISQPTPPSTDELRIEFKRFKEAYDQAHAKITLRDYPKPISADRAKPQVIAPGGVVTFNQQGGTNIGTLNVNPPPNPNAPVVTYELNGIRHESSNGGSRQRAILGDEAVAFQKMLSLERAHDWSGLLTYAEEWTKRTPSWLTPKIFAGESYIRIGQLTKGCEYLSSVVDLAAGNKEFDVAKTAMLRVHCP